MPITARLVLPERFIRKNAGTPMADAAPKQTSCRFVSPKNTLVFTLVKSRGTEIYAAIKNLLSRRQRQGRRYIRREWLISRSVGV